MADEEVDLLDDFIEKEEEVAKASSSSSEVDVVGMMFGESVQAHAKYCGMSETYHSPFGIIYCLTCGASIGSTNDVRDSFCVSCECPIQNHVYGGGRCLTVDCPCTKCKKRFE